MLDDEIVLKNCYYWAKKMVCKGVDFDALVSVGYLVGKPLQDKRLLKDWIHFTMLKYVMNEITNVNMCIDMDCEYMKNVQAASNNINHNELYVHILKANLSSRERMVIRSVYFEGKNQKVVAKDCGITQQTVNVYLQRALEKIKMTYIKEVMR